MTKVLLPFDSISRLDRSLGAALDLAGSLSAEIVLLRVNPRADRLAAGTCPDSLYSELKALQVQLADCRVPVTIESMPGPKSDAIADFTVWAGEDYVVVDEMASVV